MMGSLINFETSNIEHRTLNIQLNLERALTLDVRCWVFEVRCFPECFFQCPLVPPVGVAMAVRREKAAAKLPEPRPDLLAVGLRNFQTGNLFAREKFKASFRMNRRQGF